MPTAPAQPLAPSRSVTRLARDAAEARKALLGLFQGADGINLALDLMGEQRRGASTETLRYATHITETHQRHLREATLIVTDDDMTRLLTDAAPHMPDQELRTDDLPYPSGIVMFSEPLPDRTGVDPIVAISMLSWQHLPEGHPLIRDMTGESVLITAYVATSDFTAALGVPLPEGTQKWVPNATVIWTVGSDIGSAFGRETIDPLMSPGPYQQALAALWTLMRQSMSQIQEVPAGQPSDRRRYARAGIVDPSAPVRVVRLKGRAPVGPDGPDADPDAPDRKMAVRTAVRAYWRQTWFATLNTHRQQLIASHIRGPEGAPLTGGERVIVASPPPGAQTKTAQ